MPSFDGAAFEEQGTLSARPSAEVVGTYHRIAGGGRIWQGPATPALDESVEIPGQGTEAQYAALYGKAGLSGTLVWGIGGTSLTGRTETARLMSISSPQRMKQGNIVRWTMRFEIE